MATTQPSRVRAVLDKARADPKTALTLAGLVLYAVLWSAYAIFYEAFGLTPDDLGFGYLDLLAQTAVGAVGLTLVVGALVSIYIVVLPILFGAIRGVFGGGGRRQDVEPAAASGLGGVAVLAGVLLYGGVLVIGGAVRAVATYCLVAGFCLVAAVNWLKGLDAAGRARLQLHLAAGMLVTSLLVAAVLLAQAAADAHAVRQGRSTQPTALGFRLGSWGAERATLRWVSDVDPRTRRALEAACLMYLGTSDGTAYLYAPRGRETLRLPAGDAVISTRHVTAPCAPS